MLAHQLPLGGWAIVVGLVSQRHLAVAGRRPALAFGGLRLVGFGFGRSCFGVGIVRRLLHFAGFGELAHRIRHGSRAAS